MILRGESSTSWIDCSLRIFTIGIPDSGHEPKTQRPHCVRQSVQVKKEAREEKKKENGIRFLLSYAEKENVKSNEMKLRLLLRRFLRFLRWVCWHHDRL